jgi:hypothetical protein
MLTYYNLNIRLEASVSIVTLWSVVLLENLLVAQIVRTYLPLKLALSTVARLYFYR